ncbi:DUF1289 domain-containing protein [Marinomonas pollencensis]|uniref:DUF1289 domain-containing protein n=1 Tax=Marinomonas pollencensis TaxID=491954 RepID=UPI000E245644|nr:DUF1289 domain-containing protein [Marinomonas pollencensis]
MIDSPCIRQCCLNEQDICLGCFRSLKEILAWSAASQNEKQDTLNCIAERRAQADHREIHSIFISSKKT